TLFEEVDSGPVNQTELRPSRQERAGNGGPQFTLVGTSRIGDTYRATLQTSAGETVVVQGAPDSQVNIPGHSGFQLADLGSRNVSAISPSSTSCVDYPDRGVNCSSSGNMASLTLTTAAPVPAAVASEGRGRSPED